MVITNKSTNKSLKIYTNNYVYFCFYQLMDSAHLTKQLSLLVYYGPDDDIPGTYHTSTVLGGESPSFFIFVPDSVLLQ